MVGPDSTLDQPFPLRTRFRRQILPALAVFIVALAGLTAWGAQRATRAIYLEQAQRRAQAVAEEVAKAAPDHWRALMAGRAAAAGDSPALAETFARKVAELKLAKLKVYDLRRRTVFSTSPEGIGKIEDNPALVRVLADATPAAVRVIEPNGEHLYELYVPLFDDAGRVAAVFELYEPVDYLNAVLWRAMGLPAIIPAALMAGLVLALAHLVGRAQADIDARTSALSGLRRRLETFLSASAADAARDAGGGEIPSRKQRCALLYSDVRSFTSFAESHPPETVVGFLNALMSIQIDAVARHGGDVDKMIGDALLARFDGDRAEARAIAAAEEILHAVGADAFPRGVGVGVFTGEAILGAVGPKDRRDFTVIGDSVNVAARLCAAAADGELVVDRETVRAAGTEGFGPAEEIRVKGRQEPLAVRRWRPRRE